MSLSATIGAARDCAKTLLFDSLCTHKFQGAVPHVMLVVDAEPCTLQKVLLEGYCDVMDAWNSQKTPSIDWSEGTPWLYPSLSASSTCSLPLRFSLSLSERTPCGASDSISQTPSDHNSKVSYTVSPFIASEMKEDVGRLQALFRQCGAFQATNAECDRQKNGTTASSCVISEVVGEKTSLPMVTHCQPSRNGSAEAVVKDAASLKTTSAVDAVVKQEGSSAPRWTEEEFYNAYCKVSKYLQPLFEPRNRSVNTLQTVATSQGHSGHSSHRTEDDVEGKAFCAALRRGPARELLVFILIQRSAFQNELHQYRLRLWLFDRGMRVVEHCHLDSMSAPADKLAIVATTDSEKTLLTTSDADAIVGEDQLYSYCRSCAFSPSVAQPFSKAIAAMIDYCAWSRKISPGEDQGFSTNSLSFPLLPSALTSLMMENSALWSCFSKDMFTFNGIPGSQWENFHSMSEECFQGHLHAPIDGVGSPLKIICRDAEKVLSFHGGLEDCLTNTGFYSAAWESTRNNVSHHRRRFMVPNAQEYEVVAGAGPHLSSGVSVTPKTGGEQPPSTPYGRLRKKDYLEMLRQKGEKMAQANGRKRSLSVSDDVSHNASPRGQKVSAVGDDEMEEEAIMLQRGGKTSNTLVNGEKESISSEEVAGSRINSSIGGTFPIGEVISESFDLSKLSGVCDVFAYPDPHKNVAFVDSKPFKMTIVDGKVIALSENAPRDFVDLWTLVKQTEKGCCYVRELGIGLNPYVGVKHVLADVTSFERQWGVHLSLGLRHPLFVKQRSKVNSDGTVASSVEVKGPVIKRKGGKYHIDVFVDAAKLICGPFAIDFSVPLQVS